MALPQGRQDRTRPVPLSLLEVQTWNLPVRHLRFLIVKVAAVVPSWRQSAAGGLCAADSGAAGSMSRLCLQICVSHTHTHTHTHTLPREPACSAVSSYLTVVTGWLNLSTGTPTHNGVTATPFNHRRCERT